MKRPPGSTDTIQQVLLRALRWGAALSLGVALVVSLIGLVLAGLPGLASGLVGAAAAVLFLGVTEVGLLLAGRFMGGNPIGTATVLLSGWFVKVVVFLIAMIALRAQPWVQPYFLFASIVLAVLASLVVDAVVVARARIPIDVPGVERPETGH